MRRTANATATPATATTAVIAVAHAVHVPAAPPFCCSMAVSYVEWPAGPSLLPATDRDSHAAARTTTPVQVCTVTNASGTIEAANVTNIEVHCV